MSYICLAAVCFSLTVTIPWLDAQIAQSQVELPHTTAATQKEIKRLQEQEAKSGEVLIPALRGLSIAPTAAAALSLQSQSQSGVRSSGFTAAEEQQLGKKLQAWLDKPVTLETLDAIARAAEQAIAPHPGSLVTASFPPQEITTGHVAIVLGVPLLKNVSFTGKPLFGGDFLASAIQTRPGSIASAETIRKDLDFLNRNPFRNTTALWSPAIGDVPAANLIIKVKEKRPWNIYTGFDNYASDALGDERFYLGGKFGNVFDLDHRLGWLLLSAADGTSLHAANLNYEIPLPRQQLLHLTTGFSESASNSSLSLIDNNGQFFHFRTLLETPLPDWKNLRHRWKMGFSLRDNVYEQNDSETDITIFQCENFWEGELYDDFGHTSFTAGLLWNPGDEFLSSDDATYTSLGAGDSDSLVATIKAERTIPWKKFGALKLHVEGQWAGENLLATNQFAAAGPQRIRGYDEGSEFYDKALLFSAEWQFPRISLPGEMQLRPHLFFDSAWLADHQGDSEYLSSIGVGVSWTMLPKYAARLEFAQPLQETDHQKRNPEIIFSINTFW